MKYRKNIVMKWCERGGHNTFYYYDEGCGLVMGTVFQIHNSSLWVSKVFKDEVPFTSDSEMHLGQFISVEHAKGKVEQFWNIESKTLIA